MNTPRILSLALAGALLLAPGVVFGGISGSETPKKTSAPPQSISGRQTPLTSVGKRSISVRAAGTPGDRYVVSVLGMTLADGPIPDGGFVRLEVHLPRHVDPRGLHVLVLPQGPHGSSTGAVWSHPGAKKPGG